MRMTTLKLTIILLKNYCKPNLQFCNFSRTKLNKLEIISFHSISIARR